MMNTVLMFGLIALFLIGCASVETESPPTSAQLVAPEIISYKLKDFGGIIPGESTLDDLFEIFPHKTGVKLLGHKLYRIEYPADEGNVFYIKYDDRNVIASILYTDTTGTYEDTPLDITQLPTEPISEKSSFELSDFENITPGKSTLIDLCGMYYGRHILSLTSGDCLIEYPADNGNIIYVRTTDNGIVISIELRTEE